MCPIALPRAGPRSAKLRPVMTLLGSLHQTEVGNVKGPLPVKPRRARVYLGRVSTDEVNFAMSGHPAIHSRL